MNEQFVKLSLSELGDRQFDSIEEVIKKMKNNPNFRIIEKNYKENDLDVKIIYVYNFYVENKNIKNINKNELLDNNSIDRNLFNLINIFFVDLKTNKYVDYIQLLRTSDIEIRKLREKEFLNERLKIYKSRLTEKELKIYFNQFIIFDDNSIKSREEQIKSILAFETDTKILEISAFLKKYKKLNYTPLYIAQFIEDESKYFDIEDLIKSFIDIYHLINAWNPKLFDCPQGLLLLARLRKSAYLKDKCFIPDEIKNKLLSDDVKERTGALYEITVLLSKIRRKYVSNIVASLNNSIDPYWERLKKEDAIKELTNMDLLTLMNNLNVAIFSNKNLTKDIVEPIISIKIKKESGSILPVKFIELMHLNIIGMQKLYCEKENIHNIYYEEEETYEDFITFCNKSPKYLIPLLESLIADYMMIIRKLPGNTIVGIDFSGSMDKNIDNQFPFTVMDVSIMTSFSYKYMCENLSVFATGGCTAINESTYLSLFQNDDDLKIICPNQNSTRVSFTTQVTQIPLEKNTSYLQFLINCKKIREDMNFSGIYTQQTILTLKELLAQKMIKGINGNMASGNLNSLVLFTDSEDCDVPLNCFIEENPTFFQDCIKIGKNQFIINCENAKSKSFKSDSQFNLDIIGLSDYYIEIIYEYAGAPSPFDKNISAQSGLSSRIIF